jgi:4-amino-4-deoxy-L-arabinose transferase-like glycosyltransferase
VASVVGRCDAEWIVRLPGVLIATGVVLLAAWLASLWFGRTVGLLSGLILATMYEFYTYASDTEPDIHLCAIVTGALAVFIYLEFRRGQSRREDAETRHLSVSPCLRVSVSSFLGSRPWLVLFFFFLLGMTNLAKGLIFGTLMVAVPIGCFLLWNCDLGAIRRYTWLWGWLACLAVALAWPVLVCLRYPDAPEVWASDYGGRLYHGYIGEPVWYYLITLPWVVLPWTIPAVVGLGLIASAAFRRRFSPERFLWCWAVLTPVVFSIPQGKHHHYLLQCLVPWAILAALGTLKLRQLVLAAPRWWRHPVIGLLTCALPGELALVFLGARIPGPPYLVPVLLVVWPMIVVLFWWGTSRTDGRVALGTLFSLLVVSYCLFYSCKTHYQDRYKDDDEFIAQTRVLASPQLPLLVNQDMHVLSPYRFLFYLNGRASLLHNLTYVQDDRITSPEVYVIARQKDEADLARYGTSRVILQTRRTRDEASPADRWTLFQLRFHENLRRYPANLYISPLQVVGRKAGPYLGAETSPRTVQASFLR